MPSFWYNTITLLRKSPSCQLPAFIAEQLFTPRRRDPVHEAEERVDGTLGLIRDYVRVQIMMLRSASAPFCQQSYRHKQTRHLLFSLL